MVPYAHCFNRRMLINNVFHQCVPVKQLINAFSMLDPLPLPLLLGLGLIITEVGQRAKKVVGLVDFAIRLVNSVLNSPKGQVSFLGNSNFRRTVSKNFSG